MEITTNDIYYLLGGYYAMMEKMIDDFNESVKGLSMPLIIDKDVIVSPDSMRNILQKFKKMIDFDITVDGDKVRASFAPMEKLILQIPDKLNLEHEKCWYQGYSDSQGKISNFINQNKTVI